MSFVAGTATDVAPASQSRVMGGYYVLAADFHVHSFPMTWSTLAPWDTVIEARHQGLDVIAMTPHDQIWPARIGRWFAQAIGGPLVIVSEEVTSRRYHLLAVGVRTRVAANADLAAVIDEIHRQGGIAIAAHPYEGYWPAYDARVLGKLDAAEVVRPEAQQDERLASQLRAFFGRAPLTAIGDSDYHGLGTLGYSRTYVFARTWTDQGVLEAIREGRTVVYDRDRAFGDPAMIALAAQNGGLSPVVPRFPVSGAATAFSGFAGVLGMAGILVFGRKR